MTEDEIRLHIREAVEDFKANEYDWDGKGALPIRPDVYAFITYQFAMPVFGASFKYCRLPGYTMKTNGAVEIHFAKGMASSVDLEFPCDGVILYRKHFTDKITKIDGIIRLDEDRNAPGRWDEVNQLFRWLYMELH